MNSFIKKLVQEERLKLVDPSDEIAESYLKKADKSLISAKTLLEIENFDDATALVYYSMYYSALALLFKCGIKCENHTGTIILLKELFKIDNKQIKKAKKERVDKQYYVEFKATKNEVREGIQIAEKFLINLRTNIEKMKESEKITYKNELKKYF